MSHDDNAVDTADDVNNAYDNIDVAASDADAVNAANDANNTYDDSVAAADDMHASVVANKLFHLTMVPLLYGAAWRSCVCQGTPRLCFVSLPTC